MTRRVRGGDEREHRVGVEREVPLLQQRDRHRGGAAEADRGFVDRKPRVRIEDLRPRLAEHHHREEHRHLAAGDDHDPVGMHLDPAMAQEVRRHRLPDARDPGRRGIAVVAVAQRLHPRLDDVRRGLEVRLADAEVDDVAPCPRERFGPGQDLERGLGAEHRHPVGLLHRRSPLKSASGAESASDLHGGPPLRYGRSRCRRSPVIRNVRSPERHAAGRRGQSRDQGATPRTVPLIRCRPPDNRMAPGAPALTRSIHRSLPIGEPPRGRALESARRRRRRWRRTRAHRR